MTNIFRRTILYTTLFIFLSIIYGCSCNCGKDSDMENMIKGYIAVVGNEPFTKLALQTDDNKTYILECSKELKDELWKKQGSYYYIKYGEMNKEEVVPTIVVEKVIPFTKSDK
ncbi:MAG: hypothetical protein CVV24_03870 [Ignavibacteriae bacterium HGW-Ignavibacteriae-3]|nr:MAG: hypothetical protein CVV24_03870 [Ignavibacteriae bacterium HGW-Ignavibacteriae-3]